MCVVSAVSDNYMGRWPDPYKPGIQISWEEYQEYQRLKRMALELDRALGQPDCVKSGVDDWESKVEDLLRKKGLIP